MNCETCHFWTDTRATDGKFARGPCHRFPPTFPSDAFYKEYPAERALIGCGTRPHTGPKDWCGEWATREEAP